MKRVMLAVVLALAGCSGDAPIDPGDTGASSSDAEGSSSDSGSAGSTSTSSGAADSSTGGGLVLLELLPTDDANFESNNPDDNFGDQTYLEIENDTQVQVSYLRFVVDDIEGEILSADLRLFATEGSDYGGDVFAVDDGDPMMGMQWTEDTLTFNNAPTVQGEPIASFAVAPSASIVNFDLTAAVTLGASHSFAITTISDDEIEYSSKEGEMPPVLVVNVMTP
jgi:hypothetical protein